MGMLWLLTPRSFHPSTDLIGFPVFADFNIDLHFKAYLIAAIGFPLLAAWLFLRLRRVRLPWEKTTPVWFQPWLPEVPEPRVSPTAWTARAGRLLRLWFTGFVFGLGTVAVAQGHFLAQTIVVCAFYAGLVYTLALWIRKRVPDGKDVGASWVNSILSAGLPFAVFGVSEGARVGADRHPWFPFWLAALATLGLGLWIVRRLKDVRDARGAADVECDIFFLVVVPIFLFVANGETPMGRSWLHLHHDGESLVTSALLRQGAFPWRDFLFQHGLLQDPISGWIGHVLFEDSIWGADAGMGLIGKPLFVLSQYPLLYVLFRGQPWLLLLTSILLPWVSPLVFDGFNFRFLLLSPLFALAVTAFTRKSVKLAALAGALSVVLVIGTPEAVLVPLCLAIGYAAYEAFHREPSEHWKRAYRWTLAAGKGALGATVIWFVFLALFGALGAYLRCYMDLAAGHQYAVGIPIPWGAASWFPKAVLFPWVVYYGSIAFLLARFRGGRFLPVDAAMLAWNLFAILYYRKFLARADEHILAHVALAMPLCFWMAAAFVGWAERQAERRLPQKYRGLGLQPVGLGLFLSVVLIWAGAIAWRFDSFPARYAKPPETRSPVARWGYGDMKATSRQIVAELQSFLVANVKPEEKVFDFTNEPALFHYLLGLPVPLIHQYPYANLKGQRDLIAEIAEKRPEWIVYLSAGPYARFDNVPSQVRYYETSKAILQNYRVFAAFSHHAIFIRDDLRREKPKGPGILAPGRANFFEPCDWGYSLSHNVARRYGKSEPILFSTMPQTEGQVTEIQVSREKAAAAEALEIEFEKVTEDAFVLTDGSLDQHGVIQFRTLAAGVGSIRVPVSSCLQWKSFAGDTLYLHYRFPQEIRSVRLIGVPPTRNLSGS